MDIAIATLFDHCNFGNRLQNFALQESLGQIGASSVTSLLGLPRKSSFGLGAALRLSRSLSDPTGALIRAGRRLQGVPPHRPAASRRVDAIRAFSESRISMRDFRPGRPEFDSFARSVDFFIVGSDQVWNPGFTGGNMEWFLSFAEPARRVAYGASFGIPRIPRVLKSSFRRGLAGIPHLSVREHRAAEIVRDLIGRTPPVVVDPTLLHGVEFWNPLAVTPPPLKGVDYVLTFRLKAADRNPHDSSEHGGLRDYERDTGLTVIDLFDPRDPELVGISPMGFIGAIRNAQLVITDSFHAAVFCLIFHTPFLLERRGRMNSRLDSLLLVSGLPNRVLHAVADCDSAREVDWASVDDRLAGHRRRSLEFLGSAVSH